MTTKEEFIKIVKEKVDESKLDAFFTPDWKTDSDNSFTDGKVIIIPKNTKKQIIIQSDNSIILILAEAGSSAQILLNTNNQKKINDVRAIAHKDASVEIIDVNIGEAKSNITTKLAGQGAEANTTSLFLGKGEQQGEIFTAAIHSAPNTKSNIVSRCIINDKAKAINRGLIKIEENAFDSEGYQKQDALLLSEDATAEAIPNLEIHNNEVKCSHGSTVGQIDEEQLFYLMSRGLDENSAKQKIIEGYFVPAIEMLKNPKIKERIHALIISAIE